MNELQGRVFLFGHFRMDVAQREVSREGRPVSLTPKEFDTLLVLVEKSGRLVDKETIVSRVWPDTFVADSSLTRNISALRRALGDGVIETVPKFGYRLRVTATCETADRLSMEESGSDSGGVVALQPSPVSREPVEEHTPSFRQAPATSVQPSTANFRHHSRFAGPRTWLAAVGVFLGGAAVTFFILRGLSPKTDAAQLSPAPVRLAVLPFVNLTGHPDQEYLCDGLTEEMITVLGGMKAGRVGVIARTSSMTFKNSNRTAAEIGRSLNANYLLECSVREATNRLRINAQLIRTSDEVHVWAQEYDRQTSDVLSVEGEVARAIAEEIQATLSPAQQTRLASLHPVNPEVHELYLKGRYYWNKRTPETLKKSVEYFEKATIKDPSYAPAYAGLADSYAMLGSDFYAVLSPKEAYPKAEAAAIKSLELDPNQAEPHTALAWSKTVFDWDWQGAEREFKRAIELNPDYANAHHWYGYYLLLMGRPTEALVEYRTAESLDPLSLIINSDLAQEGLAGAGLYDEALDKCRKTLEMDANFAEGHVCLMNSYEQRGMHKEAIQEIQKAIALSTDNVAYIAALGSLYASSGERVQALSILNELKARSKHAYVPSGLFSSFYAALGQKVQAMDWLEKAYEEHDAAMVGLRGLPRSDPRRADPRFQELLRRMNFPP